MKFITINKHGIVKNTTMRVNDTENIYKKCGFKNNNNFSKHHTWKIKINNEELSISVYGKNNGRALNENKYELPPPIDNTLFFGDIAIIAYNENTSQYYDFNDELWNKIYNELMGGFEDIENTDDESEEYEEDQYNSDELTNDGYLKDGFVVDDNELLHESYEDE